MARLRWISRLMVPWWLYVDQGQKVIYTYSLLVDAFRQKLRDGLEARFPSRAGEDAAKLIGAGRLISRGRDETLPHYANRLKAWRGQWGHRVRGNAFSLLAQTYHYWGDLACWIVDRNQNRRGRATDGTESYEYGYAWDWDGGAASNWGRFWSVLGSTAVAQPDLIGAFAHWEWPTGATYTDTVTVWEDSVQAIQLIQSGTDEPAASGRGPDFDGVDDVLVAAGIGSTLIPLHQEATFIVAGRADSPSGVAEEILRTSAQVSTQVGFNISIANNSIFLRVHNGTGTPFVLIGAGAGEVTAGNFVAICGFDADTAFMIANGLRTDTATTGTASGAVPTTSLDMGGHGAAAGAAFFDGVIYEVLIFDRLLTDAEIALWQVYMHAKHGVLQPTIPFAAQDDFGDTIGIGGTTTGDWVAMRRLVDADDSHRWAPAGVQPEWMIVSLDGSWPVPTGDWDRWGKLVGTNLVPARATDYRYVALRDDLRLYAGDPTCWANAFVTPYYGSVSGDATQFPATINTPDGSTYAGDPASFPTQLRIPDDGDLPE